MDFPFPQPPGPDRFPRLGLAAALLALACYAVLLATHVGAVAGGSDSSGYMNQARLLATGRVHLAPRSLSGLTQAQAPSMLYVPLGFKPAEDQVSIVPTYPSGFPLIILALEPVAGWRHAGDLAIVLHSLAGLVLVYLLGRTAGLGRLGAAVAVAMLALSPLYMFMSLQAMSDLPSLVWVTAAVLAALASRRRLPWALAAGAAFAVSALLRPTNVLALLPLCVALGASTRRALLFGAGGLPGALFFGMYNHAAYGKWVTTGYGDSTFAFHLHYIPETLAHYGVWLPILLSPLAVFGFGLPFVRRVPAQLRWLLALWIFGYAAFYCSYQNTHETWWYLRFLLPAAPAAIVSAVLALRSLAGRFPAAARPEIAGVGFAAAIAVVAVNTAAWNRTLHPLTIGQEEQRYGQISDWLKMNLPTEAVCLAMQDTGALLYYTHFTFLRYDVIKPDEVAAVDRAVVRSGRPLYAVLFPFEINAKGEPLQGLPGPWANVGYVEGATVLRRSGGAATH